MHDQSKGVQTNKHNRRSSHRKQGIELRNEKVVSRKMRERDLRLAVMSTVRDQKHHAEIGSGR